VENAGHAGKRIHQQGIRLHVKHARDVGALKKLAAIKLAN